MGCSPTSPEFSEVFGKESEMPENKLKAKYLERLDEFRAAVVATSQMSAEKLLQKASLVETLMQAKGACTTSAVCEGQEVSEGVKRDFGAWVESYTAVTMDTFSSKVKDVQQACREELVKSLKKSRDTVFPFRFGGRNGQSWKANLAPDAPFSEVAKVAQVIVKGEVATNLCSGTATLAKDPPHSLARIPPECAILATQSSKVPCTKRSASRLVSEPSLQNRKDWSSSQSAVCCSCPLFCAGLTCHLSCLPSVVPTCLWFAGCLHSDTSPPQSF